MSLRHPASWSLIRCHLVDLRSQAIAHRKLFFAQRMSAKLSEPLDTMPFFWWDDNINRHGGGG